MKLIIVLNGWKFRNHMFSFFDKEMWRPKMRFWYERKQQRYQHVLTQTKKRYFETSLGDCQKGKSRHLMIELTSRKDFDYLEFDFNKS